MRILITGGAGYIGGSLVNSLKKVGHEIIIVDDFSNSSPTENYNKIHFDYRNVSVFQINILNRKKNTANI